jgi:hypothetical protein
MPTERMMCRRSAKDCLITASAGGPAIFEGRPARRVRLSATGGGGEEVLETGHLQDPALRALAQGPAAFRSHVPRPTWAARP